jgi:hypothetical protein
VQPVPHINLMKDDPLLSEVDVAGTWFDAEYVRRYYEARRTGLWFWDHDLYWDQQAEIAERLRCA